VDISSLVSKSGIYSSLCFLSLAYVSKLKFERRKRSMYIQISRWQTYNFRTLHSLIVTGWWTRWSRQWCHQICCWLMVSVWWWCTIPSFLKGVCWFVAPALWRGRQPCILFARTIAGRLYIAGFTFLWPGNWAPHLLCSHTLVGGFTIRDCMFFIEVHKNPPLATLAIFNQKGM